MDFKDCFKMVCHTCGSDELFLVSGKPEKLKTIPLIKIKKMFDVYNLGDKFLERADVYDKQLNGTGGRYLGFFCFIDLESGIINIKKAEEMKNESKINRSERNFCLANLRKSVKGQDLNIAEGFCQNLNTLLARNNLRSFAINRGA